MELNVEIQICFPCTRTIQTFQENARILYLFILIWLKALANFQMILLHVLDKILFNAHRSKI